MIKEINIQDVSHMYYVYQFSNIATYTKMVSQVPQPTFGSGLGLQCVYTVVISL